MFRDGFRELAPAFDVGFDLKQDLLELHIEVDEVLFDALKDGKRLVHHVQLLVGLGPFKIIKPLCGVGLLIDLTGGTGKEESPLSHVDIIVTEQDLIKTHIFL